MMPTYRLAVVTYHWPPFTGAGVARWPSMVKYLRRLGHEVTVITTSAFGTSDADAEEGVVRTRDLAGVGGLRRLLRRPPLVGAEGAPASDKPPPGVLTRLIVPDSYAVSWLPFATAAARRLLRDQQIDCLITSSPPDSVHLSGLRLGERRPAWIADLRDGWTFEPLRAPFPTGAQRRLDHRLERAVMHSADSVVTATEPITRDLSERHGIDATTIRNAWDPDLEPEVERATPPELEPDRVNLVYTGSLGGVRGHDDRALLAALRGIVRDDSGLASKLRVVLAGSLTDSERRAFAAPDLSPVVRTVGVLPRAEALALQRRADVLLLITSAETSISTVKLYEYLASGRPILTLGGENEAARIVAETGTGVTVAPGDESGIRDALAKVVGGELERRYRPRDLERYRYPAPVEALVETVEAATSTGYPQRR